MKPIATGVAALLAGAVLTTSTTAFAESADICAALHHDLALSTGQTTNTTVDVYLAQAKQTLGEIALELHHAGCGNSVMVYRGGEGNVCGPLEAEAASIENEIAFLQQERDALRQSVIYSDPSAIRAELAAYGCQMEPVREAASYSQFHTASNDHSSVIEIMPAAPPAPSSNEQRSTLTIPAPQAPAPVVSEPIKPAEERELVDLDERLQERNVRVVGPQFLPDQSEAIDLTSPVPTFFP
jgi:hypothetical protein